MNIELIAPNYRKQVGLQEKGKGFAYPPLALTVVASLTPDDCEVHIIDENVEPIDFDKNIDLVGITVLTAAAPRAYQIADKFRGRGVPVVLGGMHVSALPDEAIEHADAVVIGEAEGLWQRLVSDFRAGKMQRFYRNGERPSLANMPIPRRDLLKKGAYFVKGMVQTTRGCPFDCNFCSVTNFFGKTFRTRPVAEVINEIRGLKKKFIGFVDDNIIGNIAYAKKLLTELVHEKIYWAGQASVNVAKDTSLLRLLKRSGCKGLFIGLESVSQKVLGEIGKKHNIADEYSVTISKLHDYGISVQGAFIFGFDNDDRNIFERTLEFCRRVKLDLAQFALLTPLPGTRLFAKLKRENRITTYDWSKYDMGHVLFRPKNLEIEELHSGWLQTYKQFYSNSSIINRILRLGNRFLFASLPLWIINRSYRKYVYKDEDK